MTAQSHHLWAFQVPGRQCRQTREPLREAATPSRRDLGKDSRLGHNLVLGLPPNVLSVVVHKVTKSWKEGITLNIGYNEIQPLLYHGHYTSGTNLCIVKLASFLGLPYLQFFYPSAINQKLRLEKAWNWGTAVYNTGAMATILRKCQYTGQWKE